MSPGTVRTLIAEDEPLAREGMGALVGHMEGFEVVGLCADGLETLEAIRGLKPDLVLLDVQMPELDGFQVLARLEPTAMPMVVFVTAYDAYAVQAFEARAVDYVLKPVAPARLEAALLRAQAALRTQALADQAARLVDLVTSVQAPQDAPEWFLVKVGERIHRVEAHQVDWIQGADYCVVLHMGSRELVHRETLTHLEARLGDKGFLRIHGSTLVNLDRVVELRKGPLGGLRVVLQGGQELAVSRRRAGELLARMR